MRVKLSRTSIAPSAIDATLQPAQTGYFFYLSDPQGHNHYARTNEEFAQLLKQYGLQ